MKIAVTWELCGYADIPEAKTVEEAMKIFKENPDCIELPCGEYVDGSFHLSTEDVEEMNCLITFPE